MNCKGIKLTQNEFDALVSFTFNVGPGGLQKSSLLSYIKSGGRNSDTIKKYFMEYIYLKGKVLNGLKNRRHSEWRMFSHNEYKRYSVYSKLLINLSTY